MTSDFASQLRRHIAEQGAIPVSQFMERAVCHYYATRDPFGQSGDFITAPEISQTFGEMIGLWLAVLWQGLELPGKITLAELGPGRGTLMADMLRTARMVPGFLDNADIWLVETSPSLRRIQQQTLAGHPVHWADSIEQLPDGPLLLVANEFFDALPIEQHVRQNGRWHRRMVQLDDQGQLTFALGGEVDLPFDDPDGSIRESCPSAQAVIARLGRQVAKWGGALLVVDYGHGNPAPGDSLQAVKNHQFHPVLTDPGQADITAHVDFYALAAAAIPARAYGPVTQGQFLTSLGIEARLQALCAANDAATAQRLTQGVQRLVDPDAMGGLFKVMALTHPAYGPPVGFGA